jgi:small basic protein
VVEPGFCWSKDYDRKRVNFSPDQLNSFFTATQNGATSNRRVENNAGSDEFAFSNTFGLKVFNALHQINGMPLKFLELIFLQVLVVVTYIFNTILTTSIYPAARKTLHIKLIAKKSEPSNIPDYRPISVLPALSKAIEIIMKRQINVFLMDAWVF